MGSLDGVGGEMFDVVPEIGRTAIFVTSFIPGPAISYEPYNGDFLLHGILGNLTYRGSNPLTPEQSDLAKFASTLSSYRY